MKQNSVTVGGPCWVEHGSADPIAAQRFYGEILGWQAEPDERPEAGGYTFMKLDGKVAAAITPLYGEGQPTAWTVSFAVDDADATAARITEAGGSLIVPPMEALDFGRFVIAADPSGAVFALWQPRALLGAEVLNEPGALGWVELLTRDPDGARAFYPAVFGWSVNPSEQYTQWGLSGEDFGGMLTMDDRFPPQVPAHWLPYFAVADADVATFRAGNLGGDVLMPPVSMANDRRIAVLRDPMGAAFGIYAAGPEG
ncbi:VOC family protein [Kitasatospora sp. A2-31]|uniref:VOC family protein n=1 Tax=Kitasatospora sp. A2-31 TaxID=2916414 RepID=UPI001EEC15DC|nr:VOC family protein [Kitasatospora sp. A2-31]MCG6496128.1 VOC family protein [Kitasatospora sp. A2-31]